MEAQFAELLVRFESLQREHIAMKKALLNIQGFYIETADGSEQGLIKFGAQPVQVPPTPTEEEVPA